jgi:DNA-binding CsgD family transcriptional regulator
MHEAAWGGLGQALNDMFNESNPQDPPAFGLADAELVNVGLGAVLARIGVGVFVLDPRGRVIFSNPVAGLLGDEVSVIHGRLAFRSRAVSRKVAAEVAQLTAVEQGPPGEAKPIAMHRDGAGRPLAVYLMPLSAVRRSLRPLPAQPRAIVLVANLDSETPRDASIVQEMLGLTAGEARIASLVGSGLPPREAAARLGVSVETARSVLKRVFGKLGVSRQSELVAFMTKLLLQ